MASEYAVIKLQELIEYFRPGKVLEVGLGIGSIAGTLLDLNPDLDYTGTEANEFCLQALPGNLGNKNERLKIFSSLAEVPERGKFDLIIIDGKDRELEVVKKLLNKRGIISIEGDRMPQEQKLRNLFPKHKYVHCISTKKNPEYSPFPSDNWQGGIKIIFSEPNLKQDLWRRKEKVKTKLKYLLMR